MAELRPCPFCGGKGRIRYSDRLKSSYVYCVNCNSSTSLFADFDEERDSTPKSIEAWNRRASDG